MIVRVIVAGLASARLMRAYHFEEVGRKVRGRVDKWTSTIVFTGDPAAMEIDTKATLRRQWLGELTDCPHCMGFWATVALVIGMKIPIARTLVIGLAGAMIASAIIDHYPDFDPESQAPEMNE